MQRKIAVFLVRFWVRLLRYYEERLADEIIRNIHLKISTWTENNISYYLNRIFEHWMDDLNDTRWHILFD